MKKLLSCLLAVAMLLSLMTFTVSAEEAFPTSFEAPSSVVLSETVLNGACIQVTYNKGADLSELVTLGTAAREKYGISNYQYYIQIDWSLDSQNDWQYHSNWDEVKAGNEKYSQGIGEYIIEPVYGQTTENRKILQVNYGNTDVWSSYISNDKISVDDKGNKYIDYQEHTIYVRARFLVRYRPEGQSDWEYVISDWSPVVAYGKDSKPFEIPTSLEAPVISDLQLTETFEGDPLATFHITNPQSVKDNSVGAQSIGDSLYMHAEVSIGGGAWTSVQLSDRDVSDGQINAILTSAADVVTEDTYVQLRTRYEYHDGNGALIVSSDWSNVIQFGAPAWGNASEWATAELARADELGLIPETLEGADLTADITRAEFAAVAVKAYEALANGAAIPAVNNPFTDTTDVEVLKAYNIGAVNGTSATTFDPNALLNREQAAAMLTRVFKKVSLAGWTLATDNQFTLPYEKPALFADDADISDWAKDSVYFMVANGIINGVGNNKFAPKNVTSADEANGYANATREQALIIAVRMVENLKK